MDFGDLDYVFIVKFGICFVIFAILPVWIFNIADLSFLMKMGFTLAGGVGVAIALMGKRIHK